LTLKKVSETQVKLFGADAVAGKLKLTIDYGYLQVNGKSLRPQKEVDFPFQEWK